MIYIFMALKCTKTKMRLRTIFELVNHVLVKKLADIIPTKLYTVKLIVIIM